MRDYCIKTAFKYGRFFISRKDSSFFIYSVSEGYRQTSPLSCLSGELSLDLSGELPGELSGND